MGLRRNHPLRRTGSTPSQRSISLTRSVMVRRRPKVSREERTGRAAAKTRSGGTCEIDGRNPATEVHHRQNRSQGGSWAVPNLLHVCPACHHHITVNPKAATDQGWAVKSHQDPPDVPVWLAGRGYAFLLPNGDIEEVEDEDA